MAALTGTSVADGSLQALAEEAIRARDAAVQGLLDRQDADGLWRTCIDVYAMVGALYVIVLRKTGLIRRPGEADRELRVVRHMLTQVNPDGGFAKYPGGPSSRAVTSLATVALRFVLGEIPATCRSSETHQRNTRLVSSLEGRVRLGLENASEFMRGGNGTHLTPDIEHWMLVEPVALYADRSRPLRRWPAVASFFLMSAPHLPFSAALSQRTHTITRKPLPALRILYHAAIAARRPNGRGALRQRTISTLAEDIRSTQEPSGGWMYNAVHTSLNLMALVESGMSSDEPVVQRAYAFLVEQMSETAEDASTLSAFTCELWNTSCGVRTLSRTTQTERGQDRLALAAEAMLAEQGPTGGFAFGTGSPGTADADCTAFVLRGLLAAGACVNAETGDRIAESVEQGIPFILRRQDATGGFAIWKSSLPWRATRTPPLLLQLLFDRPSTDVTARVFATLAIAGLRPDSRPMLNALRFLLRAQHRNGAWWSAWLPGHVYGTTSVLLSLGEAGLRPDHTNTWPPRARGDALRAVERGVAFLRANQNDDGGWGGCPAEDSGKSPPGMGPSGPLRTGSVVSALIACGMPPDDPMMTRAVSYLLGCRSGEGEWSDPDSLFTFISGHFYYPYPFFNYVLPLDALNDWLGAVGASAAGFHSPATAKASRT